MPLFKHIDHNYRHLPAGDHSRDGRLGILYQKASSQLQRSSPSLHGFVHAMRTLGRFTTAVLPRYAGNQRKTRYRLDFPQHDCCLGVALSPTMLCSVRENTAEIENHRPTK